MARIKRPTLVIHIFKDTDGKWRWNMQRRGRIIAAAGEGYERIGKLKRTVTRLIATLAAESYGWADDETTVTPKAKKKKRATSYGSRVGSRVATYD